MCGICSIHALEKKRKHRSWVREWIQRPETLEDPAQLRNFVQMSASDMEELTFWIGTKIVKMDTKMRPAIPVKERLSPYASWQQVKREVNVLVLIFVYSLLIVTFKWMNNHLNRQEDYNTMCSNYNE